MANLLDTGKRIINLDAIVLIGPSGTSGFGAPRTYAIDFYNRTVEIREEELTRKDLVEVLRRIQTFHELPTHE